MADKYDVGVLGVWYGCNYGSIATYYALHTMLRSMGKSVLMIDKPIMGINDFEISKTHSRRFAEKHYEISNRYELKDLKKLNQYCNNFLLGSDQLWNYGISKGTGKTFYLDFVDDDKKKIAYATSFGHSVDFAPEDERKKIAKLMAKFEGISLREDDGVKICRDAYAIRAVQVLDPVFVVPPETYQPLIRESQMECAEPYIASYILDPTPEKKAALEYVSKQLGGLKVINLLDGVPGTFEKNRLAFQMPNCIENLHVEDWLKYLSKARFVVTDSCHGMSFAMIFKRDFIGICNKKRGFSRFQSLSRQFNIGAHIVSDAQSIINNDKLLKPVNYDNIDKMMNEKRQASYQWLLTILNAPKKTLDELLIQNDIEYKKHIKAISNINDALESVNCTGCGACAATCPKDAINMQPDEWGYYRSKVSAEKCIHCKKCIQVCTALKTRQGKDGNLPDCYAYISSDKELLRKSSSGGVFTALARKVLEAKGAVVGAAWRDDFSVEHIIVENESDLWKLRKSKYLQSYVGDILRQVKQLLDSGRQVLFSGTPCQVAGLRSYLGKDYDRLLCVDIFCSNAPSAMFFQKYAEDSFGGSLKEYEFRYKSDEVKWDCFHIRAELKDGQTILRNGPSEDAFQRVFHNHVMCSPHCEKCTYQLFPRAGDLSIGDFWGIGKQDPTIETANGVSIVLCNTAKGRRFFDSLPKGAYSLKKKVPIEWMGGNGFSLKNGNNFASPNRDKFYKLITEKNFSQAVTLSMKQPGKLRPINSKTKIPLRFDSMLLHFRFDHNVWEEHYINGYPTLIVKNEKWKESGHYIRLSMARALTAGKQYTLNARVKIKSASDFLSFHVIESGGKRLQIIHREKIAGKNDGSQWIDIKSEFTANADCYDEIMFGARQVSGLDNALIIDYIKINER